MKLKSLKITSFLFLVLSFPAAYANMANLTSSQCVAAASDSNSGISTEQSAICTEYIQRTANTRNAKGSLSEADYNQQLQDNENIFKSKMGNYYKTAAQSAGGWCDTAEAKSGDEPAGAIKVQAYGSSALFECEKLSFGNMRTLYDGSNGKIAWANFINHSCKSKCTAQAKQGSKHPFETCVKSAQESARRCEALGFLIRTYGRSWNNSEQTEEVGSSSSSGAVGAKTTQSANGSAASVSIGGAASIKCVSKGIETLDYDACKKFQVQLDLMDGIQQVGYGAQELIYKDKMMDSQMKYANEQNTATGALKAQGESLKDQESMYQQRTAVDAVKLGALFTIYNDFPKTDDIKKKCASAGSIVVESIGPITEADCKAAATAGQTAFAVTMNQQQIEAMRSRLIGIATSAGSNLLLANLLGKRADDVDNAIAKIDAFKPADPFTTSEADAQTTFCRMNPGVASCLTGDLERTFDTMNDNVITFGDGATGTSYGTNTNADGSVISSGLADSTTRSAVGPVGSVIAAAAQDNSIEKSDAAKVNTSGTGSSGGGGSGGGSAGGGGGGGGGAPAAAAAGQAAAIAGRAPNYNGGGGSFSVMGGFGINKKKADGKVEDNPFGKLFGKEGTKGGEVNFRDIASQKVGGKGDNLFDMISKRYGSVNADKRLLEYELKK